MATRNAELLAEVIDWADSSDRGIPVTEGPLAGVTWDQGMWATVAGDGKRTCCLAGGTALLAGAQFCTELPRLISGPDLTAYTACRLPGSTWPLPVQDAAGKLLGLEPGEYHAMFSPHRTVADLRRLQAPFEKGGPLVARSPVKPGDLMEICRAGFAALAA